MEILNMHAGGTGILRNASRGTVANEMSMAAQVNWIPTDLSRDGLAAVMFGPPGFFGSGQAHFEDAEVVKAKQHIVAVDADKKVHAEYRLVRCPLPCPG